MAGRLGVVYLVLFAVSAALAATAFVLGAGRRPQPKVDGIYAAKAPACLGSGAQFRLEQSGQFVDVHGLGAASRFDGTLLFRHGRLTGTVRCVEGSRLVRIAARRIGPRDAPRPELRGTLGGRPFTATYLEDLPKSAPVTATTSARKPTNEQIFGRLMLAIAAVILAARVVRAAVRWAGQPPVMGEVLAGILLGPTLLGAIAPSVQAYLFPQFVIPLLVAAADIGLAFYMFLVGLELDPRMLKGRLTQAAAISNGSVVLPLGLGILVALPLFKRLAPSGASFDAFALFMGVAMAITAFPVLARILIERRMLKRPLGALALSAAAIDDVTAWGLLAIATGIAGRGSAIGALQVLAYVFAFCALMALLARPLLERVSAAYDEAGHVPSGWITAIFVGVLLSAYVSMKSGIAPIFGAFVMGLVMPRRADLSHDVTRRLEDFVGTVLLPLFFVVTGLRTDVGLLNRVELWGYALLLLGIAVAGKWIATVAIARVAGFSVRESAVLGALVNTRGLTELIVLNIGLELGVISRALFTMLVLMALVTTFMTVPLLRALDPRGLLSAPVEEELEGADRAAHPDVEPPQSSILVAPLAERNVDALLHLAEPLARSQPPHELILVRPLEPPHATAPVAAGERELARANRELARLRRALHGRRHHSRSVAFTSVRRGEDLVRLAADERVGLIAVDGRRPLLGAGVPRGDVGFILANASCDAAVLVCRRHPPALDREHPVVVAFGGQEHDWAGLELGALMAAGSGAPLRLVAAVHDDGDGPEPDAGRLLAAASLAVQRELGVDAEPVLAAPGRHGLIGAAHGAGVFIVGLPDRWRDDGLGRLRAAIVRAAPAPILLVRRADAADGLARRLHAPAVG